jgi:tRNA(fMet)-specific endonuclease VapC
MGYLLDTNTCIALLNGSSVELVSRMKSHHPDELRLSSVVRAELCYGARKSRFVSRNLEAISHLCAPFRPLDFDRMCAEEYGVIRAELEALGTPIGPYDLMIAATARAHSLTVVTHNTREYRRVVALEVEDWLG